MDFSFLSSLYTSVFLYASFVLFDLREAGPMPEPIISSVYTAKQVFSSFFVSQAYDTCSSLIKLDNHLYGTLPTFYLKK